MKKIVQDGTPVLRRTALPVPEELFGSGKLARLIEDMRDALDRESEGVALAAPQLGVLYRLFIVRKDRILNASRQRLDASGESRPDGIVVPPPEVEVYINPEIIKTSRRRALSDEGCLSLRGVYGTTKRHERVTMRARRPNGSKLERGAGGLLAQIFEHEIDHLNGILFTDHAEHLIHITHAPVA